MASKPDDDDDVLKCPICLEYFTDPKNLPCNNTFCKSCLKSYIETQVDEESQSEQGKTFPCPVCKQIVNVVGPNMSAEKIAEDMPSNGLMVSLIKKTQSSGLTHSETYCAPWVFDEKKQIASSWCTSCLEALCENCKSYHKRLKQTKNYTMIPIDDIPKDEAPNLHDGEEPCMKHSDKVLEVYCADHKEMCCVICLAKTHRKCERIFTFEDLVTQPLLKKNVETFRESLKQFEMKTTELRKNTEERLHKLEKNHGDNMQQTSSILQEAKDKLDLIQSEVVTKFEQTHKGEMVKITERLEVFEKCVKKGQALLEVVENHGSLKQLFITKEKLKMQLKDHMIFLQRYLKEATYNNNTLEIDADITSLIKSLTTVAEIEVKPSLEFSLEINKAFDVLSRSYCEDDVDESRMDVDVRRLTVSNISSTRAFQFEFGFTGGTFLPDGRMVFCSDKLLVYDRDMNHLFETHCLGNCNPNDVCCVSDCNIIVSISWPSVLQKFEVTQTDFIDKGTIQINVSPHGLAASKKHIVVGGQQRVDILTLDGQFLKIISFRQGSMWSFVAVYQDNVYFSDSGNRVLCTNLKGEVVAKFTNPKLKDPRGIAVDRHGNVFAVGFRSENVVVFSADGTQSKEIIQGLTTPEGIGFDPTGTKFFITDGTNGAYLYRCWYN